MGVIDRRLKVVFLGHTAQLSGGELSLLALLPALTDVDSHVVLAEDGPLVERLRKAQLSVEVMALPARTARLRKGRVRIRGFPLTAVFDTGAYVLRVANRLRVLRPDLVHTNSLKAHLYGGLAARLVGVPHVWHARDRVTADYLPRPAVAIVRAASWLLPAAVIANSQATLQTLPPAAVLGVRRMMLPSPVPEMTSAPPRHFGDDRPMVVGCIGRLAPWKGQDVLLRAVARAFPNQDVSVRIVGAALFGEEDYEASLHRLIDDLGLGERVVMTGFVHDVPAELARIDVLVHCSRTPEPFGRVIVEGMTAMLPVIAADAGGPAEIVVDGQTGLLTPPGDSTALAAALRRLADDPNLRRRLGTAGAAAAAQYRPEVVAPQLGQLYREVLSAR